MWHSNSFVVSAIIYMFCACVPASGDKCRGQPEPRKLVDFQERFLFSPGYPQNYETNDECTWNFAAAFGNSEYVIQLATIEIDLNDHKGDCNTDYLEAYEGDGVRGHPLAKWCGNERRIVKAQRTVTLRFQSDRQITGKGFIISYSLIKATKAECAVGETGRILVGAAPVYEYFKGHASVARCEWQVQSEEPSKKLLVEMFEPSSVSCNDGSFDFYDGGNTSSHVSYEYCSTTKPFSLMFLRSDKAAIILQNKAGGQLDGMVLRISARSPLYVCTVSDMPTIEVKDGPVIFALPLAYNARNTPCPVRLLTADRKKHLRLDVMGTDEKEADCRMDVVEVKEMVSNLHVLSSCNRNKNPVYRQSSNEGLIVTSLTNVYMRAAAVDSQCDGNKILKVAASSLVWEDTIPSHGSYSNLDYCRYLVSAEKSKDLVHLSLRWNPGPSENRQDTHKSVCHGDFINIYDGDNERSPVLFSSCWPLPNTDSLVSATVQSSQRHVLVVLDADAKTEGESFRVKYHSVPGDGHCLNATQISVTKMPQNVTSPGYPKKFPMNQLCTYNLVAENPKDEIVVKVVEAGLHDKCKSYLAVYEGEYQDNTEGKVVGRVCGRDKPTIRIPSSRGTLVAVSDSYTSPGGWKVEVHAEEKVEASGGTVIKVSLLVVVIMALAAL